MKSYRHWWSVYWVCSALLVVVTGWLTISVMSMQAHQQKLQATAEIQEDVRLALWRMDSQNVGWLAAESARPFFHYRAYYPHQRAYTRLLEAFGPDDLLVPSPLLDYDSPIVRLHFQQTGEGKFSSPEVPRGNLRDLAEATGLDGALIDARDELLMKIASALGSGIADLDKIRFTQAISAPESGALGQVRNSVDADLQYWCTVMEPTVVIEEAFKITMVGGGRDVALSVADDEAAVDVIIAESSRGSAHPSSVATAAPTSPAATVRGQTLSEGIDVSLLEDERSIKEAEARQRWIKSGQGYANEMTLDIDMKVMSEARSVDVDVFETQWIDAGEPMLALTRKVTVGNETHVQGYVVGFAFLANQLLEGIEDLFPNATLRPLDPAATVDPRQGSRRMATLPVMLEPGRRVVPQQAGLTPVMVAVVVSWGAVAAVVLAVGLTMRSIIAYSHRRSRFASAVAHELRTPLTTFQVYSELLDEGLVPDEETQKTYFKTLRRESSRLGRLVENVLSFARLEDGRHVAQMSDVPLPSLLQSVMERLEERSSIASMELVVSPLPDDDATITTSPVVVEQIMGNLVDNACKYGASPILVSCELTETEIIFQISDGGPGLEPEMKDRIFEPFDRGSRSGGDPSAGVGLGLSLSEELARDLGGTLLLTDPASATFTLSLPRSPA